MNGNDLKALRVKNNWTQTLVGYILDRSPDYVDYVEIANRTLKPIEVEQIQYAEAYRRACEADDKLPSFSLKDFQSRGLFMIYKQAKDEQRIREMARRGFNNFKLS